MDHYRSFVLSLVSFISVLQFLEYKIFASLFRLIPSYLIVFHSMVSEIVSLISLSDILLLVCENTAGYCTLILYPAI